MIKRMKNYLVIMFMKNLMKKIMNFRFFLLKVFSIETHSRSYRDLILLPKSIKNKLSKDLNKNNLEKPSKKWRIHRNYSFPLKEMLVLLNSCKINKKKLSHKLLPLKNQSQSLNFSANFMEKKILP